MLTGQPLGQGAPAQALFLLQTEAQAEGDGGERNLAPGAAGIGVGGQVVAQGGEVDEAQGHLEARQGLEDSGVGQVGVAQVALRRAVAALGRRRRLLRNGKR